MDTFKFKPTEDFTLAKATQGGEAEALAGATFEPTAFVEGIGEVQPAEALQVSLEAVVASLPTEVESTLPEPGHASPEELVTRPPSEVICRVGCPWVQFLGMKQAEKANRRFRMMRRSGDRLQPRPSGRNLERKLPSQPTYRAEAGTRVIPRQRGRMRSAAGDRGGGIQGSTEKLDVILPEGQEPLTGVGARGMWMPPMAWDRTTSGHPGDRCHARAGRLGDGDTDGVWQHAWS